MNANEYRSIGAVLLFCSARGLNILLKYYLSRNALESVSLIRFFGNSVSVKSYTLNRQLEISLEADNLSCVFVQV